MKNLMFVQVSNWFINARVRLWKPMIEDMYQQELKEAEGDHEREESQSNNNNIAQTPTTTTATTSTTEAAPQPTTTTTLTTTQTTTLTTAAGKRSLINASDSDSSLIAINNSQLFSSESQPILSSSATIAAASEVAPPPSQCYDSDLLPPQHRSDDTCRLIAPEYGTTSGNSDIGSSTLIRFGTTAGDVSLTLGLRHAGGNLPDKAPPPFSVRDFGGI